MLMIGALLVAVIAGWMVQRYLAGERARIEALTASRSERPADLPTVEVLVFTADVPVATIIQAKMLGWQAWHSDQLNPRYITRTARPDAIEKLEGSTTRQPLYSGAPVIDDMLIKRTASGFLAAVLNEGMRAVAFKIGHEAEDFGGLIQAGDRVDVILTHTVEEPTGTGERRGRLQRKIGEVIIRDVRVIAIDAELRREDGAKAKIAKVVTLEVDEHQAVAFELGQTMGKLSLVLRSAFGRLVDDKASPVVTDDTQLSAWNQNRRLQPEVMRTLTATRDLSPGTLISNSDLSWGQVEGLHDDDKVLMEGRDEPSILYGALVPEPIVAGRPLTLANVIRPGDGRFLAKALKPGMRAISIAITAPSGVAGLVTPGDYVDVVFAGSIQNDKVLSPRHYSETIASGIRCLSIETKKGRDTGLPTTGATATLEVPPKLAESIVIAATTGNITLTVRPAGEPPAPPLKVEPGSPQDLVAYAFNPAELPFATDLTVSNAIRWIVSDMDTPSVMRLRTLNRAGQPAPAPPPLPIKITTPPPSPPQITVYRGSAAQHYPVAR